MRLKEALYVLICACFWLLARFQHFLPLVCLSKSLCCENAFGTYHTVCLQMKLNYVRCICFNNANSFSQEEGKCCGFNKNVKQFTALSAPNINTSMSDLRQE